MAHSGMRIIGGQNRGRRLHRVHGSRIRPTSDRVRESIFNMLGDVSGQRVLDLYAGTGAMALEALSRGAATATCVDSDISSLNLVERNATLLGNTKRQCGLVNAAAVTALRDAAQRRERFDLVFVDPPYPETIAQLLAIAEPVVAVTDRDTLICIEASARDETEVAAILSKQWNAHIHRQKRYGDSVVFLVFVGENQPQGSIMMGRNNGR